MHISYFIQYVITFMQMWKWKSDVMCANRSRSERVSLLWSNRDVCVFSFSFRCVMCVWPESGSSVCRWERIRLLRGEFQTPFALCYCKNSFSLGKHLQDLSQMMKCTWGGAWFHNLSHCACVCVRVCVWPHERRAAQKFIADSFHCDRLSALKSFREAGECPCFKRLRLRLFDRHGMYKN